MTARHLAGHAAARALRAAGVPWVAGVSGESFLPLLDGLQREGLPFVSVVQESAATFLASSYARVSGRPAVVAVTRGPGASNALIGIHEASQAGAPVVLIVGQLESRIRGRKALQEMEFTQLFASTAKATFEVTRPDRLAPSILAALRKATLGRPGPVVVSVPADHFFAETPETDVPEVPPPTVAPILAPEACDTVARLISSARRGLVIAGAAFAGARHADLLGRLADRTGFGVVGGHAFPDVLGTTHPSWIACSTIRGPGALRRTLQEADTIVLLDHWLGDRVTQGYLPLAARIVAIAETPDVGWDEYLGATLYAADPIVAAEQLDRALGGDVTGSSERREWVAQRRADLARAQADVFAANRQQVVDGVPFAEIVEVLDACLPSNVTVTADAGSFNDWMMRYLPFHGARKYLGTISGSMGIGLPAGIGAQLARPDARTVVLTGDGGFLMTGLELANVASRRLPITVVVFRNRVWGSIAIHQDRQFAGRRFAIELPDVSFAALARALGAVGSVVSRTAELAPALREAFSLSGAALVEVWTDAARPSPSSYEAAERVAAVADPL